MLKAFRKLWKSERGNVLVIFGAALPLLVGAAGLANDTIQWTLWKRQLQRAADSAAIAGVYDRESSAGSTTGTSGVVSHDLEINNHNWMALKTGYPQVTYPTDSGVMRYQVSVSLAIQQKLPFSSIFLSTPPTIIANATAASIPSGGDACIEALDPAAITGVTFTGNSAIYMPDCDIFSNSAGTNSAIAQGSTTVTANSVGGVGGIQQSNKFTVQAYRPYSPAMADPFSDVNPDPNQMNCGSGSGVVLDEDTDFSKLNGVNCFKSVSVKPNRTLNIPANFGPIYVNGGDVRLQGDISCSGCTLVLTNKDPSPTATIGNISVNATTNTNITAPTSGTYQGIAIMQDRRAGDCNNCNKINGNSGSIITGAMYFPTQELQYNGTGNTTATCTMFVAKRMNFSGNSGVSNKFKKLADCSSAGLPSSATTRIVRLVG